MQFQGLAQGARHFRPQLDNRLSAKLRLVDDADHLLHHISPESCSEFVNEIKMALGVDVTLAKPPPPPCGHVGYFGMVATHGEFSNTTSGCEMESELSQQLVEPSASGGTSLDGAPLELQPDGLDIWLAEYIGPPPMAAMMVPKRPPWADEVDSESMAESPAAGCPVIVDLSDQSDSGAVADPYELADRYHG